MVWTIVDSKLVYGVNQKDLYYLDINNEGKLELVLYDQRITFENIINTFCQKTKNRNISFAIRIPQLITEQIKKLLTAFREAKIKYDYKGTYFPIYPIKVNHTKFVIDSIIKTHPTYGFESGTKSEFVLLQQALKNEKHRLVMCNGAKDREFLKAIKKAIEKGFTICLSIESVQELKDTLAILSREGYELAFRVKPYVALHGHWGVSSCRDSKFGLSIAELVDAINLLKKENAEHLLTTLHTHPGSQITDLRGFKGLAAFMAGIYKDIKEQGFSHLTNLNFGGGMPVDYDNRLDFDFMEKYAESLIGTLAQLFSEEQPNILTESGRAITALSTIIIVKTIDKYAIFPDEVSISEEMKKYQLEAEKLLEIDSALEALKNWEKWEKLKPVLHSLKSLHEFEAITFLLKKKLREKLFSFEDSLQYLEKETFRMLLKPEFTVQGNFSVFNSICDSVLVKQYFPTIPINNLHTQPESIIRLFDITCDSDGEVAVYNPPISDRKLFTKDFFLLTFPKPYTLNGFPVGKIDELSNSYLVIPLAGAYQDIIEFDHNLLGDLSDVLVAVDDDETWKIFPLTNPQSIGKLLAEVGFESIDEDDPYFYNGPD